MVLINGRYKEYELDNGLVVALQNTPTQTIATKLRVNYGPSHEREGEEGMAHFLEHCLVTGGSQKYDPVQADEMRGSFGSSNASTSIGRTFFFGQMLIEDFKTWLDYISDHVFRPRFDADRVRGERERVLREISDAKSNPTYQANQEFNAIFYKGHPKGRFELGKEEIIRKANLEKISRFHSRGYHPNNLDLIVVGGIPENTEELIAKYFGHHHRGEDTRKKFPELTKLKGKKVIHRSAPERLNSDNPEESSASICLAYTGPMRTHRDSYSTRAMNQILGGDANSLLSQKMGLKKGLAYYAETFYNGDYNAGELRIYTCVPAKRIDEAVDSIFEEIQRMKTERVVERKVEGIRRTAKYDLAKAFESNGGYISAIDLRLDEGLTPESFMNGYNGVTPDRILEVANRYLPDREKGNYVLYIRNPLRRCSAHPVAR